MLKLFRRVDDILYYHEAWANGSTITEHRGIAGKRGDTATHNRNQTKTEAEDIADVLSDARANGYSELEADDFHVLLVEYAIDGMGSRSDLTKRHALEERLNETLGWTGLGHVDGGSIGSGTMEVCCIVADFASAKATIESDLKNTKFSDFTRIYDENGG